MASTKYVIGIDGGGTKTTALLVSLDGTVVSEEHAGSTNLQIVGSEQAAKVIVKLLTDCCKKINCEQSSIQTIVLGLAGVGRAVDKASLLDELQRLAKKNKMQLPSVVIETDARIALEAAFASSFGIVLIAGTGSIALAKAEDGKIYRAGGWGRILGDEGSGYVIGRQALNAAIRSSEGRGDKTKLLKFAFEHFGVTTIDDLITKIYRENADVASFVPKVFQAELEFDHIAHNILFSQANELAELVRVLVAQMQPKRRMPVSLMGGLLESENVYSKMVKERIARSLPQIIIQKPKFPTAFGAAIIGLKAFEF
jgi:N-acetylglucosamine kinase-like BadF-type ATPase